MIFGVAASFNRMFFCRCDISVEVVIFFGFGFRRDLLVDVDRECLGKLGRGDCGGGGESGRIGLLAKAGRVCSLPWVSHDSGGFQFGQLLGSSNASSSAMDRFSEEP